MTTTSRLSSAAILGIAVAAVAVAQPPIDLAPAEMLKRADTDGDGKVSRAEFIASRTAQIEKMFSRMDTDGDGTLDAREAEAAAERMRAMVAGDRAGPRRPDGARAQRPGDERPRPAGGEGPGAQAFDRLDGDGDGKLSREEFAEGMARMREFMQRDGQARGRDGALERRGRGAEGGFRRPPAKE